MMKPLHPGRLSPKALEYLKEVVEYGFGNSSGPEFTTRFERAFVKRLGLDCGIAHCNGTATLHSCLAAAGVKAGDEVIIPPLTAGSTSFCVLHQGAVPVFADIDDRTFNISPRDIERKITSLTKAIIPVHLYGLCADMDPIMGVAKRYGLAVIEDSAECFLGTYKGRLAGTLGHMASFSFQASKHLTCGDGGIVVTNSDELATKVRKFACLGYHALSSRSGGIIPKLERGDPTSSRHDSLGWNYRMSDLQGAVALEQTERVDEIVGLRMKIGGIFHEASQECPWLTPQFTPAECTHSYWTFACRFDAERAGCTWKEFRQEFYQEGGDFLYGAWRLTYDEPIFQDRQFPGASSAGDSPVFEGKDRAYGPGLCPVAEKIQPSLMQFKTNYVDLEEAREQADILQSTIRRIDKKRAGK